MFILCDKEVQYEWSFEHFHHIFLLLPGLISDISKPFFAVSNSLSSAGGENDNEFKSLECDIKEVISILISICKTINENK